MPSLRFHLTVNDLSATHLKNINSLTDRFLKKWSGLPHPATLAFLHMKSGLNIKSIYDIYMECHKKIGDRKVNHCIDSQLNREKEWTRKQSAIVNADNILSKIEESNPNSSLKQQKSQAKDLLQKNTSEFWHSHVKSLVVQGRFLDLLASENSNFNWKSIAYNLPSRICKFLINSVSDTLNTRANLHRWGRCQNTKCKGCGNHETLHHVLNNCTKFLNQGRYTWRHNNILSHILKTLTSNISAQFKVFCDLEGHRLTNTTIPTSCIVTNLIPDLCIYSNENNVQSLTVVELTVPFELNAESAHTRKVEKYASLMNDLEANGVESEFIAVEIGSRGYINCDNSKRLQNILRLCDSKVSFKDFKNCLSKLAILSSYVIYHAKDEPSWDENIPLLSVS